jgi:hypothetical protein
MSFVSKPLCISTAARITCFCTRKGSKSRPQEGPLTFSCGGDGSDTGLMVKVGDKADVKLYGISGAILYCDGVLLL